MQENKIKTGERERERERERESEVTEVTLVTSDLLVALALDRDIF